MMPSRPTSWPPLNWTDVARVYPTSLVQNGGVIAGAWGNKLFVRNERGKEVTHALEVSYTGLPRVVGGRVYAGNGYVETVDPTTFYPLFLSTDLGKETQPSPLGQYTLTALAWDPDGRRCVLGMGWKGSAEQPACRIMVFSAETGAMDVLFTGAVLPPQAILATDDFIAIGHRRLHLYAWDGTLLRELDTDFEATDLSLSADGTVLLAVNHTWISLWDTRTWQRTLHRRGEWEAAALGPDGKEVFAVGFPNTLHRFRSNQNKWEEDFYAYPDEPLRIMATADSLFVTFRRGTPLRAHAYPSGQ